MYFIVTDNVDVANLAKQSGAQIMELKPEQIVQSSNIHESCSNVTDFLFSLGIRPHLKGFHYIKHILETHFEKNISITKELYPYVAKHFDVTPGSLERAIRHAIQQGFNSEAYHSKYNKIFGPRDVAPTNGEFITSSKVYLKEFFNI